MERQGIKFEEKDASATYNRDSHRLLVNNTRHERLRTLMELHRLEAQQRSRIRDTKSQERIRNKTQYLTELTIPELKTTELTLNQTTLELQKLTSRHDHRNIPDELKGTNIVVDEKLSETHPEIMDKTFSFHLKNQSMLAPLEHVTVSTGTTFEVSRHAVSIQPKQKPAEANEQSDQ